MPLNELQNSYTAEEIQKHIINLDKFIAGVLKNVQINKINMI